MREFAITYAFLRKTSLGIGSGEVEYATNILGANLDAFALPLSRPLFIYVNARSAQVKPGVKNFVDFYIEKAPTLVSSIGYVPLPAEGYHLDNVYFNRGKVGTVFEGKAEIGLAIGELLRKEAKF